MKETTNNNGSEMTTLIITTNSNNDKIATLFTKATYGDLRLQSKDMAITLVDRLIGKTDKVNGKVVTSDDAQQAINEIVESLDNDTGAVKWATQITANVIVHSKTGQQYYQGAMVGTVILEKGDAPKAKNSRGSRNGVTLAKKIARKMLPTSSWKMVKLLDDSQVIKGDKAIAMWEGLNK
tara:strand:- start:7803 stop:8342 length:540 start_codon:yes stop_codon:yes gene_type:complete